MRIKRALVAATVAGGVAVAGAGLGTGLAAASTPNIAAAQADHQQRPGQNQHPPAGWTPGPVQRPDHNSFNYWGQQVTPQWHPEYHQWGFWFFGFWIPVNI